MELILKNGKHVEVPNGKIFSGVVPRDINTGDSYQRHWLGEKRKMEIIEKNGNIVIAKEVGPSA